MQTGAHRPGIGGYKIPGQVIPPKFSSYPKGEAANAPAWVAYDRQVCCLYIITLLKFPVSMY